MHASQQAAHNANIVTTKINPMSSQSSPLLSTTHTFHSNTSQLNNDIKEEDEEEDDQFLDASDELPQQVITMEPSDDLPSSSTSPPLKSVDAVSGKPFGRRSIIVCINVCRQSECDY